MHTTKSKLEVQALNVYYGQAHAIQDVSFTLGDGVLAIVGRNGMGKSTLCKALTGMVPAKGSIQFNGQQLLGLEPHEITHRGVAYVPQGRRVWRSLTVDETLRLSEKTARTGAWTLDRVYQVFPRLAERRNNGGAQLSGGEQQMLAIGRALLFNPALLVMDEPTEGLAPVIVEQVATLLKSLANERSMSVLLIEQNLGVALEVADTISVMVNGRISTTLSAQELEADRELQQRLLGVSSGAADLKSIPSEAAEAAIGPRVVTLVRPSAEKAQSVGYVVPWQVVQDGRSDVAENLPAVMPSIRPLSSFEATSIPKSNSSATIRRSGSAGNAAYVVGTFDTRSQELAVLRQHLERLGMRVVAVDLSTSGKVTGGYTTANISANDVAQFHPQGLKGVFGIGREASQTAMSTAFVNFLRTREDVGGMVTVGGVAGAALVTKGMQSLDQGIPKVMVATAAIGHENGNDIFVMYAIDGLKPIGKIGDLVLSNAASALAGMMRSAARLGMGSRPAHEILTAH